MIDVTGLDVLLDDRAPDGASSDMQIEGRRPASCSTWHALMLGCP